VDRSGMRTKHHSPAFKFETGESGQNKRYFI
jgi:hypothetical protein